MMHVCFGWCRFAALCGAVLVLCGCDALKPYLPESLTGEKTVGAEPVPAAPAAVVLEPFVSGLVNHALLGGVGAVEVLLVGKLDERSVRDLEEQMVIYHRVLAGQVVEQVPDFVEQEAAPPEMDLTVVVGELRRMYREIPALETVTVKFNDAMQTVQSSADLRAKYVRYFSQIRPNNVMGDLARLREVATEEMAPLKAAMEREVKVSAHVDFFGVGQGRSYGEEAEEGAGQSVDDILGARANWMWLRAFARFLETCEGEMKRATMVSQSSPDQVRLLEKFQGGRARLSPEAAWEDFQAMRGDLLAEAVRRAVVDRAGVGGEGRFRLKGEGRLLVRALVAGKPVYFTEESPLLPGVLVDVERGRAPAQ